MKTNYNSLTARLYREFFNTEEMPNSLCPYFWKMILACFIGAIFSPLWALGAILKPIRKDGYWLKVGFGALVVAALFILGSIIVFLSSYWFTYYRGSLMFDYYALGLLSFFVIVLSSIVIGLMNFFDRRKIRKDNLAWENRNEPVKVNIVNEYFKAKAGKYCPKLTWENNTKEE